MSTDTEAKKAVKPRPVARYFGAIEKDDKKEVERVSVDVKKKPKSFEGDVINVETKAKPFGKTKWNNQKGAYKNSKHFKNRKHLQLKVDPYALQRHSREYKCRRVNSYRFMPGLRIMGFLKCRWCQSDRGRC